MSTIITRRLPGSSGEREHWREWATRHRVAAAILAGLVATHIATVFGYWMPGIGLPKLDWNTVNGALFTPKASVNGQFAAGGIYHYASGIVFSILFACALHPVLPWRDTRAGNTLKALVMGTILAVVAVAFMTPYVYAPAMGATAGFLSLGFGWQYILAVFLWHWVYGLHLGLIYNPLPEDADAVAQQLRTADEQLLGSRV